MNINEACYIFQITKDDTEVTIKKKYRELIKKWHPDLHAKGSLCERKQAEQMTKRINNAREIIFEFIDASGIHQLLDMLYGIRKSPENKTTKNSATNNTPPNNIGPFWDSKNEKFKAFINRLENSVDYFESDFLRSDFEKNAMFTWQAYSLHRASLSLIRKLNLFYYSVPDKVISKKHRYHILSVTAKKVNKELLSEYQNGDEIFLSFDYDGLGRGRYSVRDRFNRQIAYIELDEDYYDSIIFPLCEFGSLVYSKAVIKNKEPLKINVMFEITEKKCDYTIVKERLFNFRKFFERYVEKAYLSEIIGFFSSLSSNLSNESKIKKVNSSPTGLGGCYATYYLSNRCHAKCGSINFFQTSMDETIFDEIISSCVGFDSCADEFLKGFPVKDGEKLYLLIKNKYTEVYLKIDCVSGKSLKMFFYPKEYLGG